MRGGKIAMAALATLCLLPISGGAGAAESYLTDKDLTRRIGKILQSNPELILDVLRDHSEEVLEIAQMGSNLRRKHNLELQWQKDLKEPKSVHTEDRPLLGSPDARVKIVAFSDFTCHYCQQASRTLKEIMEKYRPDVSLVFKHLPLDEKGPGGRAAEYFIAISQQDENKAWNFYERMFEEREKLLAQGEDYLKSTAQGMGLDMKRLNRDLQGKKVKEILKQDEEDARKLGVEGTPYFLVNDLVVRGALPKDLFGSAVDYALNAKKKQGN